ncbi:LOB domain-containing protein 41-like, partial [Trifolium medium]|nr:LOB domain-containing protein 41-like [Trifolium medium]
MNRSASHESSISHQSEAVNAAAVDGESKESESETSMILFRDEPEKESNRNLKRSDRTSESGEENVGLELTLGLEPVSRVYHVVPVKKRRVE